MISDEGIEHLWSKAAQQTSWTTATEEIKSKRYTYARLQRMGAYLTLGYNKRCNYQNGHGRRPTICSTISL